MSLSLVAALVVLLMSSSERTLEERLLVILEAPEEDVGGEEGLGLIPKRRNIASPTQSLHFCWLPFEFVLDNDFFFIEAGRCKN